MINMIRKYHIVLLGAVVFLTSCREDPAVTTEAELDANLKQVLMDASGGEGLDYYILPESNDFDALPQDPRNPLTVAKVNLGRDLFHETGLSLNPKHQICENTYSCSSCHFAAAGFQAGRRQSMGDGAIGFGLNGEGRRKMDDYPVADLDVQTIRSPSAMNGAYQEVTLWNGQFGGTGMNLGTEANWEPGTPKAENNLGYEGLEVQAIAAINVHRLRVDSALVSSTDYKALFDEAFGNLPPNKRYSREAAGLAIAAYERTVVSNEAPFQMWLRGDYEAMSDQEKKGAILFFSKAKCATCHTGPALNSMAFYALGMNDLQGPDIFRPLAETDPGRGGFTKRPEDMYKFKVPQLYNLTDSRFYGHGGNFVSVRDVVQYKSDGVAQNPDVPQSQLAEEFKPLHLTSEEIDQITAFLEGSLNDPNLWRYEPNVLPSGQCFPNNDPESKADLGCN